MPQVIVEMKEGRTIEQKKQLVENITAAFTKIGTRPETVFVLLRDNPKHNWGVGGKLSSEKS